MIWRDILDLLKVAFAYWGFWLFAFGIIFILVFRRSIAALIERVRKVGHGQWAAEADAPPEQKVTPPVVTEALAQATGKKAEPQVVADQILEKVLKSPLIADVEEKLKADFARNGLTAGEPETLRVTTTLLATSMVIAEFERLYNVIWTSQIEILRASNDRSLTVEEIRKHYDQAAARTPVVYEKDSFDRYLGFLTTQLLLTKTTAGQYGITVKGRAFLAFMVQTAKPWSRHVY